MPELPTGTVTFLCSDIEGSTRLLQYLGVRYADLLAEHRRLLRTTHSWPEGIQVQVRIGLHTGEPSLATCDHVGLDVHRAARICAAGHGGQILLSETTRDLIAYDLPAGSGRAPPEGFTPA
jgi:class 3 adenylate cyclase